MALCKLIAAALVLTVCGAVAFAETMPPFAVAAGDGVVWFDNVRIQEHPFAGATLFNAVAVNRTGCDFNKLEVEIIFVAGEGDRFDRVTIENFRNGASLALADRRVAGPSQEVQAIRALSASGPGVCAKAVAAEKAERERKAREVALNLQNQAAATKKAAAEKADRIAAVKAKAFNAGFMGLYLGMSIEDVDTLLEDNDFAWKSGGGGYKYGRLLFRKEKDGRIVAGEESGEKRKRFEVESGSLDFIKDKLVRIRIKSPAYAVGSEDPAISEWVGSAFGYLKNAYGNPARTYVKFPSKKTLFIKDNSRVQFVEWKKKTEGIILAGASSQASCNLEILFEEKAAVKGKGMAGRLSRKAGN